MTSHQQQLRNKIEIHAEALKRHSKMPQLEKDHHTEEMRKACYELHHSLKVKPTHAQITIENRGLHPDHRDFYKNNYLAQKLVDHFDELQNSGNDS